MIKLFMPPRHPRAGPEDEALLQRVKIHRKTIHIGD